MATFEATLTTSVHFNAGEYNQSYVDVQAAEASSSFAHNSTTLYVGQNYTDYGTPGYRMTIYRGALRFDLSDLSINAIVTAAVLKLYGVGDTSTDDFDVTVVGGNLSSSPSAADYSKAESVSYGEKNTSTCSTAAWNSITINAAGMTALNEALQERQIELYVRSSEDIAASEPTTAEWYTFRAYDSASSPVLELTYYIFGEDEYPTIPTFPDQGRIDLATYGVIRDYLTGIDADLEVITAVGNINLTVDNWITWTGTSEKIAYDDANSRVTFTTLEAASGVTLGGDLVTADLTVTTTGGAVDCTVANDALLSDTAYASIQSGVTDDESVFSAVSAPTPADDEGDIYIDTATGDLMLKTRDDGQTGTKTATLVDYSGI